MTEETENLVLELLRRIRDDLNAFKSEVREGILELKMRISGLEQAIGNVQASIGQIQISMGSFTAVPTDWKCVRTVSRPG